MVNIKRTSFNSQAWVDSELGDARQLKVLVVVCSRLHEWPINDAALRARRPRQERQILLLYHPGRPQHLTELGGAPTGPPKQHDPARVLVEAMHQTGAFLFDPGGDVVNKAAKKAVKVAADVRAALSGETTRLVYGDQRGIAVDDQRADVGNVGGSQRGGCRGGGAVVEIACVYVQCVVVKVDLVAFGEAMAAIARPDSSTSGITHVQLQHRSA